MFVRTKKRENGKVTIQIVKTVRTGEKVYQKTVRSVATVFAGEVSRLVEVADHTQTIQDTDTLKP